MCLDLELMVLVPAMDLVSVKQKSAWQQNAVQYRFIVQSSHPMAASAAVIFPGPSGKLASLGIDHVSSSLHALGGVFCPAWSMSRSSVCLHLL